ncbi:MAG: leucine-rich repeat protein [Clostridia bacterium]|nr:leucine-rich repeat protein [Clostridia bacterium]
MKKTGFLMLLLLILCAVIFVSCDNGETPPTTKSITGISFESGTYTYDGTAKSLAITGTLPEGVTVSYEGNDKVNAGNYTVTATFTDSTGNYAIPAAMTATLTIAKAPLTNVAFENASYTYDGTVKSVAITGALPEGVTVSYEGNDKVNAGNYTVTATFTDSTGNYAIPAAMTATLTIAKAPLTNVAFENASYSYDGTVKSLAITGTLPEGVTVSYEGNDQFNPGTYPVVATFTDATGNYDVSNSMTAYLSVVRDGAHYDVTFVDENGSTVHTLVVPYGTVLVGSQMPQIPSRDGYTGSWIYSGAPVVAPVTLSSIYIPNIYIITYNVNGGAMIEGATQSVTFDAAYTLREPTRIGYTFAGYTLNDVDFVAGDTYIYSHDITIVAKWEINTYTVVFDMAGGSTTDTIPTTYTVEGTALPTPVRDYYSFAGWYNGDTMVTTLQGLWGDLTLVAKWNSHFTLSGGIITSFNDYGRNYGYTVLEIPSEINGIIVTSIGQDAFYHCNLTSVVIPSDVTSIGEFAFRGSSSLTSVAFGANSQLTSIGDYAFSGCSNLTSVAFGENSQLASIGEGTFRECVSLTSITIPSNVTRLEWGVFMECSSLMSVTFGVNSQLAFIGHDAFRKCCSLTSITIPSNVNYIGLASFMECSSLASVTFGVNSQLTSIDDRLFSDCSSLTSITLPSRVTKIGNWAFQYCDSLTSITIPESVTEIGDWAFQYCSSLMSVTIPYGMEHIGLSVFMYCSNLTTIIIPVSVKSIDDSAFYNCSNLTTVYYGGTPNQWLQVNNGSSNTGLTLATYYYYSATPPIIGSDYWYYWYYDAFGCPAVWRFLDDTVSDPF